MKGELGWSLRYFPHRVFQRGKRKRALFPRRTLTATMERKSSKCIITNHGISGRHEPPDIMHCEEVKEQKQERPNIRQLAHAVRKKKVKKLRKLLQQCHE